MSTTVYAGHLCATHVGEQVLFVDDIDLTKQRWTIANISISHKEPTIKLTIIRHRDPATGTRPGGHEGSQCFKLDPRQLVTVSA